jgi:hypothetical protein
VQKCKKKSVNQTEWLAIDYIESNVNQDDMNTSIETLGFASLIEYYVSNVVREAKSGHMDRQTYTWLKQRVHLCCSMV